MTRGRRRCAGFARVLAAMPMFPVASSDPPTLAIVSPCQEDGGAEQYLRVIAQAAGLRGWSVHVAVPPLDATAALREQLRAMGVRCHPLPVGTTQPASWAGAVRLAAAEAVTTLRLLHHIGPATILVNLPHPDQAPGVVLASALYPARSVTTVQLVPLDLRVTTGRRLLYGAAHRLGQHWVAISLDNRHRLTDALGWRRAAMHLIYLGVADNAAHHTDGQSRIRRQVRDALELPPDAKIILTVARLNHQKAHDVIADSIRSVVSVHADAWWVWVGDGPAREALMQQLEEIGVRDRVRVLGHRDDVARLLTASDLFVFPSRYEGLGLAVLEALLSELPVVVSDAGPLREIVRDGIEGRMVPAEDAQALSVMTSWALQNTRETRTMATAGRRRVLAEFSRARMVERTLALLWPTSRHEPSSG